MTNPIKFSNSEIEINDHQQADGFLQSFVSHPASVGETYFGHLFFAMKFAARLFVAGFAALVHAFIPAWFETTASEQVKKIHADLASRHAHPHHG